MGPGPSYLLVLFFFFWNLLCRSVWLWTQGDLPVCPSVLGLKAFASTIRLSLHFLRLYRLLQAIWSTSFQVDLLALPFVYLSCFRSAGITSSYYCVWRFVDYGHRVCGQAWQASDFTFWTISQVPSLYFFFFCFAVVGDSLYIFLGFPGTYFIDQADLAWTQKFPFLCLASAVIKGMCYHHLVPSLLS